MQLFSNKGVTLIENVVAIAIMAIVIPATMLSHVSAQRNMTVSRHHYQAVNIARNELEQILSGEIIIVPGVSYTRSVSIDGTTGLNGNIVVNYPAATLNVDIVVSWVEAMWTDLDSQESLIAFVP